MCVTWLAHLILLDLITIMQFSLSSFYYLSLSLSWVQIFFFALYPRTPRFYISHPHETTGGIILSHTLISVWMHSIFRFNRSWTLGSSVNTKTRLLVRRPHFDSQQKQRWISLSSDCLWNLPRVPGFLTPGAKRPGREAGHWLPSSAEIKNA